MRGPLFHDLIEKNELNLPKNTNIADFEALYTLLLEARGNHSQQDITRSEEKLVLTVLCRFPWPGKKPPFISGICALLSNFTGVSESEILREKFKAKLSPRLIRAATLKDLSLGQIGGVFKRPKRGRMSRA